MQIVPPFKTRKLTADEVAEWEEITSDARGGAAGAVGAVGKAVAGAVLPGVVGKAASAALGATVDATSRPPRTIRVDWMDGKQSLIKLPEKLFIHLSVLLKDRQVEPVAPILAPAEPAQDSKPDLTGQVLTHLAGFLKDRRSTAPGAAPEAQPDVTEHIAKLAALRDQGILTDEEFATKKAELLARL